MKKDFSATKGKILLFVSMAIGIFGFLFFAGSVGDIYFSISTNYVGIAIGLALMGGAFFLGSRNSVKKYMEKYSNKA